MKFKKPKFWDYEKPNLISYLLIPFTLIIIINNFLLSFKKRKKYGKIKTICVGNIYLGGTGKTPTTIEIYRLLKERNFNVFTAKKFYKSQVDEEIILKNKTKYISSKSRDQILIDNSDNMEKIFIFDDGLQDRKVKYDLEFVCFDSSVWVGNGCLIPAGPLREKIDSLKKYDGIFLKDNNNNVAKISNYLKKKNIEIPIFKTFYKPININKFDKSKKYLAFAGIGNPEDFKKMLLKNDLNILDHLFFPDHHIYTVSDILAIKDKANHFDAEIITTEKDYVKIPENEKKNIDYLEIDLKFEDENNLINFLKSKIYE